MVVIDLVDQFPVHDAVRREERPLMDDELPHHFRIRLVDDAINLADALAVACQDIAANIEIHRRAPLN